MESSGYWKLKFLLMKRKMFLNKSLIKWIKLTHSINSKRFPEKQDLQMRTSRASALEKSKTSANVKFNLMALAVSQRYEINCSEFIIRIQNINQGPWQRDIGERWYPGVLAYERDNLLRLLCDRVYQRSGGGMSGCFLQELCHWLQAGSLWIRHQVLYHSNGYGGWGIFFQEV